MSALKLPFLHKTSEDTEDTLKSSYFYAIDIGTEVLKVLLCQAKKSGVEVLAVSKIPQQQKAMKAGVITNLDTVSENIKLALNEIRKKYDEMEEIQMYRSTSEGKSEDIISSKIKSKPSEFPDPKTAIVGLAGELVIGMSVVVNYDREDLSGREITAEEAEQIIQKVSTQVAVQGTEEVATQLGYRTAENIEIIHITITGFEIDKNTVEQLEGFRGSRVSIYLYASFSPKVYVDAVDTLLEKLGLNLISLVSQPFAIARAFSREELSQGRIIFVDVGGGTTDIAITQGTSVVDTKMFAFGGRVFTKRIAKEMNLDYRHAESRKLKYSSGELDPLLTKKVQDSLKKDVELWVEGLRTALELIEDIKEYPDKIYLCGGGCLLGGLKEAVSSYPWRDKLEFRKHPKVKIITPTVLDNVYDKSGDIKSADDVTPASLARFAWDIALNPDKHIRL